MHENRSVVQVDLCDTREVIAISLSILSPTGKQMIWQLCRPWKRQVSIWSTPPSYVPEASSDVLTISISGRLRKVAGTVLPVKGRT